MVNNRIKKLLIANRGEIALRIERACKALKIPSVTTVSDADSNSYFAKHSREITRLEGNTARDTYLNIDKIIRAARGGGCNAVHPGYGFLSENAEFAESAIGAGMIFVGPRPECIRLLGNKLEARKAAQEAGVPVTPGSAAGRLSDGELEAQAENAGYPVIIKAALGGGGRGMRIARNKQELHAALPLARAESLKSFSDERVYVEKYIENPRHIEVQLFGDNHGNLIHLGTRECSVQRRHQKLVEEAPAPNLPAGLRAKIEGAAVAVGKAVRYNNAGTAEFLAAGDNFYFLEMNTRIQVEHPVTEEVTGLDLVVLQLKVAQGEKLPLKQSQVKFKGHAIEFRIYTEDPAAGFAPALGEIGNITHPRLPNVREDFGFDGGDRITPHYDAMISKIIVKGASRAEAVERSRVALSRYKVEGLPSTAGFHRWILEQRAFLQSTLDIGFLDREFGAGSAAELSSLERRDAAHKTASGRDYTETVRYTSKKFKHAYRINILHRADGTFLLAPHTEKGRAAKEQYMRRSNILSAGLNSLIGEVLEVKPPSEIFP